MRRLGGLALGVLVWGCAPAVDVAAVDVAAVDVAAVEVGADVTAGDASEAASSEPAWYQGAVIYEAFVRSFRDADGDGVGDLAGLLEKLDYLNDGIAGGDDLGVDALWLMPIFPSPSEHGYDVTDYRAVNPDYGSAEDLDALVAGCEARGIRLVLDLVVNHCSWEHPWFVDARAGRASAHRNWFVWRSEDPGWTQPFGAHHKTWHPDGDAYYYGLFWKGMPDLNYREPAVVAALLDVASYWTGRGVAGFRLDAARYLVEAQGGALAAAADGVADQPETHAFLKALRARLLAEGRGDYLVGEVWTSRERVAPYFGGGEELSQAFDFDLAFALEKAGKGKAAPLRAELARVESSDAPWAFDAVFLGNHDLDRLSFRVDEARQRALATIAMLLPGSVTLYYGDELGMGMSLVPGDLAQRGPMAWDETPGAGFSSGAPWVALAPKHETHNVATALADPDSLLNHYRAMIALRRSEPALRPGGIVRTVAVDNPELFVLTRINQTRDSALVAVVNLGETSASLDAGSLTEVGLILGSGPVALSARQVPAGIDVTLNADGRLTAMGELGAGRALLVSLSIPR